MVNAYQGTGEALALDGCKVHEQRFRELLGVRIGCASAGLDGTHV